MNLKSNLPVIVLGVISSLIATLIIFIFQRFIISIIAEYPFQSYVVISLSVIIILLIILAIRQKRH